MSGRGGAETSLWLAGGWLDGLVGYFALGILAHRRSEDDWGFSITSEKQGI